MVHTQNGVSSFFMCFTDAAATPYPRGTCMLIGGEENWKICCGTVFIRICYNNLFGDDGRKNGIYSHMTGTECLLWTFLDIISARLLLSHPWIAKLTLCEIAKEIPESPKYVPEEIKSNRTLAFGEHPYGKKCRRACGCNRLHLCYREGYSKTVLAAAR